MTRTPRAVDDICHPQPVTFCSTEQDDHSGMLKAMKHDIAIEVSGLTKTYLPKEKHPIRAVQGLDLNIPAGQVIAFLGPNGAGKSTTLDMILGLIKPTAGKVLVCGQSPQAAIKSGQISAVLQSGGLLNDLSVHETLRLLASTYRWDSAKQQARIAHVIERADLKKICYRKVSKCSGGEKQKLRHAIALLSDPTVIVLDEPTAGMDVSARRAFWQDMHQSADAGQTIIFATHYLHEAEEFADRTVVIDAGRIVADGQTSHLRETYGVCRLVVDLPEHQAEQAIRAIGAGLGQHSAQYHHGKLTVTATSTDQAARILLNSFDASNLEITRSGLDDVFVHLTDNSARQEISA